MYFAACMGVYVHMDQITSEPRKSLDDRNVISDCVLEIFIAQLKNLLGTEFCLLEQEKSFLEFLGSASIMLFDRKKKTIILCNYAPLWHIGDRHNKI